MFRPDPDSVATTQLTAFMRLCERRCGEQFSSYWDFDAWSVREASSFWTLLLEWSGLHYEGALTPALTGSSCEHSVFFPHLRLSYIENLLYPGQVAATRPALTAVHWDGSVQRWSFGMLRAQVAGLCAGLKALGIHSGEHIALVAHNNAAAVAAALAAAALGCPLATAAPDLGGEALVARLSQLEPVLLLIDLAGSTGAVAEQRAARLQEAVQALPSLRAVVVLDDDTPVPALTCRSCRASDLVAAHRGDLEIESVRRPFNHPLFILFTSGTTGAPKCLVHGAGGTLLEHVKEHRLHCNLSPTDKLFFHTSIGWMMWHWQLSALASGAELVLYDGPISSAESLWAIVARERVTVFGTGPAYLQLCERGDPHPLAGMDFEALRAVLSTGSVLYPSEQAWVSEHIKHLPVQSISGGTDIVGCFVLGNPNLPAYSAECQCRSLGLDVRSVSGPHTPPPPIGELVCMNPFPSRPLGFLHDHHGARFHAAYFAQHEGCWTHGDLIEFTAEGTALIHGRSDGVMNVRGIRIGPAEIYRILRHLPEICEAMAVEQTAPDEVGGSRMVLLLVLRQGCQLDGSLTKRIQQELRTRGSSAHVPDLLLQVAELPTTYSGKRSEKSVRDALNGIEPANAQALRNPASLEPLLQFARRRSGGAGRLRAIPRRSLTLAQMTHLWENVLGIEGLKPADNFFELSGDSITALRLLRAVQGYTRHELPLSLLYGAPTIAALLEVVNRGAEAPVPPAGCLRLLNEAQSGAPFFLLPGIGGSAMELQLLARSLITAAPVFGLEAPGLRPEETPYDAVEEMARAYVAEVRALYPHGPYRIGGYSFGGLVAYEMAQLLSAAGEELALVALLDTTTHERFWPNEARVEYLSRRGRRALRRLVKARPHDWEELARQAAQGLRALWPQADGVGTLQTGRPCPPDLPPHVLQVRAAAFAAFARYQPRPCAFPLTLLRSDLGLSDRCDPRLIWTRMTPSLTVHDVQADHYSMIRPPQLSALVGYLSQRLEQCERSGSEAVSLAFPDSGRGQLNAAVDAATL